jgi:hypothetical protein
MSAPYLDVILYENHNIQKIMTLGVQESRTEISFITISNANLKSQQWLNASFTYSTAIRRHEIIFICNLITSSHNISLFECIYLTHFIDFLEIE